MREKVEFLESFLIVGLVMTGLAGLSYNLLRDDGWLERFFGSFLDFTIRYPLIALPLVAGAIVLGKLWRDDRVAHGKQSSIGATIVLYTALIAGVYYAARLALAGSL